MDELEKQRMEIDTIDREMAILFEKRMAAASGVAAYKRERGLPVLDTGREQAVVRKNEACIQDNTLRPYYSTFITHLMGLSRQYQRFLLGADAVAYQGAESGFGHRVLTTLFPNARPLEQATFEEVFEAVESGDAGYGIVPFENSTTGDVSGVLDLCFSHNCHVAAMYDLPVCQNLLGLPGAALGDIRRVYSHVQALEQSRRFLNSLGAEQVPFANTALAAAHVAEQGDKTQAAIASLDAAGRYGLVPLAEDIATEPENTTRFIIITRQPPQGGDRFSLLLTVENRVGMLARIIEVIAAEGFDMENIKSRPMPKHPFEYYFYVELVGETRTQAAQTLLEKLGAVCRSVRLLGTYHRVTPGGDILL